MYVYDIDSNHWSHLPPLRHYKGVPHIIGGKLAIIGGRLPANKEITNMVSTYSEDDQAWVPYYPNLQSKRSRPGVVSHHEYVIVAGGRLADQAQDSIEVLNWIENL